MTVAAVAALAVGGMMGAAPYMLLGLAALTAGGLLPLAFLVSGAVAALSVYSYAKLGAAFPSRGGAAHYLRRGFGPGTAAGGFNVFQYLAYIIATALYAAGFAEYFAALLGNDGQLIRKGVAAGIVVLFAAINLINAALVGRAETLIIVIEIGVLIVFAGVAVFQLEPSRIEQPAPGGVAGIVSAAALLYVTYQGFGVAATAGASMQDPRRNLPRALYLATAVVAAIYLIISTQVVMLLDLNQHNDEAGHLLAVAAKAIAGQAGFVVIGAAALLATASAINATLFATGNIGYDAAEHGEIDRDFTRKAGPQGTLSLLVAAVAVVLLVIAFPLSAVGQMTSLAFLIVYAAVNVAHLRLRAQTGARRPLLLLAILANLVLFVMLFREAVLSGQPATWITLLVALAGSFAFEAGYRRWWLPRHPRAGQTASGG